MALASHTLSEHQSALSPLVQELASIHPKGLFIQSLPFLDTSESDGQDRNHVVHEMMQSEMLARQSKELFSRLKFNAVELQTKLSFLEAIYDNQLLASLSPLNLDEPSMVKKKLVQLKSSIETMKSEIASLAEQNLEDLNDLEETIQENEYEFKEIRALLAQISEHESIGYPEHKYSTAEAEAIVENQGLLIQELKETFETNTSIVREAVSRCQREKNLLEEYEMQLSQAQESLRAKKEEAALRDAKLETLYHWYDEMSHFLAELYAFRFEVEELPPYRLVAHYQHHGEIRFLVTLDEAGLPLTLQCEPANLFDAPWCAELVGRSREARHVSYLFHELNQSLAHQPK